MLRRLTFVVALSLFSLPTLAANQYYCKGVRIPGAYLEPGRPDRPELVHRKAFLHIWGQDGNYQAQVKNSNDEKIHETNVVSCETVSGKDARWFLKDVDARLTFPKIPISSVQSGRFCEVSYGKRSNPKKAKLYYFFDSSGEIVGKLILLGKSLGECMK